MKRFTCIREILDCFDYHEKNLFMRFGSGKYFRKELLGHSFVKVTIPRPPELIRAIRACRPDLVWHLKETEQRESFARIFRAYVFRSVREGRAAGLDYLTICYALCRKLADASKQATETIHMSDALRRGLAERATDIRNDEQRSGSVDSVWAQSRGMARFSMRAYANLLSGQENFGRVHCMESPVETPLKTKLAFLRQQREIRKRR